MPDTPTKQPLSEIEKIRQENIRRQEALLQAILKSEDYLESQKALQDLNYTFKEDSKKSAKIKQKKSGEKDETFKFSGNLPTERRRSARLENKDPEFTMYDLPEDDACVKAFYSDSDDLADLEKIVSEPKNVKRSIKKRETERVIMKAEDVTDDMINNVCKSVKNKKYSENGTSCHQCRQKTLDQKTICRNKDCIGVRGQVCGVCAKNRYGERVEEALKDPDWHCYVCRNICNCSFCRTRAGKRPTGILAPIASKTGYSSVKDLLDSLGGTGDFPSEDDKKGLEKIADALNKFADDPDELKELLGFVDSGRRAVVGDGATVDLSCDFCISPNPTSLFDSSTEKETFLESLGVARIKKITGITDFENGNQNAIEQIEDELINKNLDGVLEYLNENDKDECAARPDSDDDGELLGFDSDGNAVWGPKDDDVDEPGVLGFSEDGLKVFFSNGKASDFMF